MDFYHYRMDVYTHIYVQTTCKVNFASDDPFKAEFEIYPPESPADESQGAAAADPSTVP